MNMIKNMSQERMEWLYRVGIRSAGDIKATGPKEVYDLVCKAGHAEDQLFYYALLGAAQDVDTFVIIDNLELQVPADK